MSRVRAKVEQLYRELNRRRGAALGEIVLELIEVEYDADGNVIDRGVEIIVTHTDITDERTP